MAAIFIDSPDLGGRGLWGSADPGSVDPLLGNSSERLKTIVYGVQGRSVEAILKAYGLVVGNTCAFYIVLNFIPDFPRSRAAQWSLISSVAAVLVNIVQYNLLKLLAVKAGKLTVVALAVRAFGFLSELAFLPWYIVSKPFAWIPARTRAPKNAPIAPSTEPATKTVLKKAVLVKPAETSTPEKYQNASDLLTGLTARISSPEPMRLNDLFDYAKSRLEQSPDSYRDILAIINYRLAVNSIPHLKSLTSIYSFSIKYYDVLIEDAFREIPKSAFQETQEFKDTVTMLACWTAVASLMPTDRVEYLGTHMEISKQFLAFSRLMRSLGVEPQSLEVWAPAVCLWVRLGTDDRESGLKSQIGKIRHWARPDQLDSLMALEPKDQFQRLALDLIRHVFAAGK